MTLVVVQDLSGLDHRQVVDFVALAQDHVRRRLRPAWGVDADVVTIPAAATIPPGAWPVTLVRHEHVAGALGHHEAGVVPFGVVAVEESAGVSGGWRRTAMHEIDEMLINPWCDRGHIVGDIILAMEVCDYVEDDDDEATNFVLPSVWVPGSPGPWDADGRLPGPVSINGRPPLTHGGYATFFDLRDPRSGWQNVDARGYRRAPARHTRPGRLAAGAAGHGTAPAFSRL